MMDQFGSFKQKPKDRKLQSVTEVTRCQWLSLILWALLLIGVFTLLIIGPGMHGAFSKLGIFALVGVVGTLLVGVSCICCYFGYDALNTFLFGPNMEKQDGKKRQQEKPQVKQSKGTEVNQVKQMKGVDRILNIKNLNGPKREPLARMDHANNGPNIPPNSRATSKFSPPGGGPFTVENVKNGSSNLFKSGPCTGETVILSHAVTTVQPRSHPHQRQSPEPPQQPQRQQRHPRRKQQPRQKRPPQQKEQQDPKRQSNWFYSADEDEGDEGSIALSGDSTVIEIEDNLAARVAASSAKIRASSRTTTARGVDAVERIRKFSATESLSDVPEPFVYQTPVKHKKTVEDDLEIEQIF